MKAIVTGGCGFIGSHITDRLLDEGYTVTVIDNMSTGRRLNLNHQSANEKLTIVEADINDVEKTFPFYEGVDVVYHIAALADIVPSIEMPQQYFRSNVDGTFNVLECVRKAGVKRMIYAASSSCYGLPDVFPTPESAPIRSQYPYALTKNMGEQLCMHWHQVYGINVTATRFFNVYGTRSRTSGTYGAVFGVFLAQKLNKKPYTIVGDGTQTRDFTYVTDTLRDIEICKEFEVPVIATCWGYDSKEKLESGKPDYIANDFKELENILTKLNLLNNGK